MTIYLKRIFILALLILSACLDLHSSIIFTTALKDIGRNCWDHYQRSNDTYIERFLKLAQNISYPLIAYLEKPLLEKVSSYTFPENVIFIDMECVDTFYDKYYEREKQIIESPEYKKKVPQNRWNNPEHKYAEYTLITHSKCNFVAKTKKLYPDFTFYAWIDFGCIYHIDNVPQDLFLPEDLLKNKITFPLLKKPEPQHRLTEEKMLGIDDIYIDGSQYIIHKNLVFLYEDLYRKKIEMWQSLKTCDDDQTLVYQLYMDDPELFFLVEEKHWFTLFYHFRKKN